MRRCYADPEKRARIQEINRRYRQSKKGRETIDRYNAMMRAKRALARENKEQVKEANRESVFADLLGFMETMGGDVA